ncbi:MAG TPA: hemerythrin family protein [Candidatus Sumerlaeota bacterium]|nr:hemerythrin family protein [Candidatus Sumerlaeota bacterium]
MGKTKSKIEHQLFRTGVLVIDNQHEQYLDFVDELFALTERPNVEQSTVDAALERALAYAVEHFDAEEALMRSIRYPGYESHRTKHDEFRNETDRLCAISRTNVSPDEQLFYLTKWLVEWFCDQTQVYDKALAIFLKKREQKSPGRHTGPTEGEN